MSSHTEQRTRAVRLPGQLGSDEIATLVTGLRRLDGVIDVQQAARSMKITYHYPVIGFDTFWQLLHKHAGRQFGLVTRFRFMLLAYSEQVERQHLLYHCGWDTYVSEIFVASYQNDHARRASQSRNPWQQVKRTENPAR